MQEHETPQRTHVADVEKITVINGTAYGPGSVLVTKELADSLKLRGAKVRKATEADQPKPAEPLTDQPPATTMVPGQDGQETAPEPAPTPEAAKTDTGAEKDSPGAKKEAPADKPDQQVAENGTKQNEEPADPLEDQGGWGDVAGVTHQDGIVTGEDPAQQAGAPALPPHSERKGQLGSGFPARAKLVAAGITSYAKLREQLASLPDTLTQDEVDHVRAEMVEA